MKQSKFKICLTLFITSVVFLNVGFNQISGAKENLMLTTNSWTQITGTDYFSLANDNANVISNNTGSEIEFIRNSTAPATYQSEHYICVGEAQELNCSSFYVQVTVKFDFFSFNESGNIILNFLNDYDSTDPPSFNSICYLEITHQESNNNTNYGVEYTHDSGVVAGSRPLDSYTSIDTVEFIANRTEDSLYIAIVDPNTEDVILSEQTNQVINWSLNYILIDYETNSRNDNFNATISNCFMMLETNYSFPIITLPPTTTPSFPTNLTFSIGYSSLPAIALVGMILYVRFRKERKR